MKILYFTSTGNSLMIAKELGGELISIPQLIKNNEYFIKADKIGIICPIYSFSIPAFVKKYLEKVQLKAEYIFVIGTYGDRYGGFANIVEKTFKDANNQLDYVNVIKMVDNALHAGYEIKNQVETLPQKRVAEKLEIIKNDVNNNYKMIVEPLRKERGISKVVTFLNPVINAISGDRLLKVDDNCIKCGICTQVCPVNNIEVKDAIIFKKHCELCLGCLHNCPSIAIHVFNEKSSERYRNKKVSLEEIIKANSQL